MFVDSNVSTSKSAVRIPYRSPVLFLISKTINNLANQLFYNNTKKGLNESRNKIALYIG